MPGYHDKTLNLVGLVPQVACDAAQQVAAVEQRIGRQLPASLREWYSLNDACALLERYSNTDPPVPIADLGQDGLIARDLLVIRHENQGVCYWAVLLDGSDDPPVVVTYDDSFSDYLLCAETFSAYVHACVWDWGLVLSNANLIQAQNSPLSEEALQSLRRDFAPELTTSGWPGHTQYRLSSADQKILIWAAEDQADWWLAASTERSLLSLVKKVWRLDDLRGALWSTSDSGKSVLCRLRGEA